MNLKLVSSATEYLAHELTAFATGNFDSPNLKRSFDKVAALYGTAAATELRSSFRKHEASRRAQVAAVRAVGITYRVMPYNTEEHVIADLAANHGPGSRLIVRQIHPETRDLVEAYFRGDANTIACARRDAEGMLGAKSTKLICTIAESDVNHAMNINDMLDVIAFAADVQGLDV